MVTDADLAEMDIGELWAEVERLRELAGRVVETFVVADSDLAEAHDAAVTALGAALGYDLQVRPPGTADP